MRFDSSDVPNHITFNWKSFVHGPHKNRQNFPSNNIDNHIYAPTRDVIQLELKWNL